jgi:transglutaminase-like putative cysteine protease
VSEDRRLFRAEAILLIAVAIPLAMSEGVWWYWAATVLAVVLGRSSYHIGRRAALSSGVARVAIILAFVFLCFEYFWAPTIPILALAHFMMVVCFCRLMQRRTPREHAQILVLALLLLVIAAIVSDHVVFLIVLTVFVTVGMRALLRFHLLVESCRTQYRNALVANEPVPREMSLTDRRPRSLWGIALTTSGCALAIGIGLFVLFPRVGAGMLGHSDRLGAGRAVTGFSPTLDFKSIHVIRKSDRPVMRVRLTTRDGQPVQAARTYYFRGTVLVQYGCRRPRLGTHWEWQEVPYRQTRPRSYVNRRPLAVNDPIVVVPELEGQADADIIEQQYLIESASDAYLFSCYPAVELEPGNLPNVQEWPPGQVLKTRRKLGKTLRYTVRSAKEVGPEQATALARHRQDRGMSEPTVLMPAPTLPREDEIREYIARITEGVGPLNDPDNRYDFAERVVAHLQSDAFTYTLSLPPLETGVEPVGEFLLNTRRGHCEYFASAMAVMCQLSGIPARVVNGYRSTEYNDIGHFFLIRQKDAHAWVEAFIPGYDWVTFDPTPGERRVPNSLKRWVLAVRGLGDYLQFQWADLVVAYGSDHRHELLTGFADWVKRPVQTEQTVVGAVVAFVRELFGWRLQLTTRERVIYWVFTLLVTLLIILISYVVIVVSRRITDSLVHFYRMGRSARRRHRGAAFYQQFSRQMTRLGFERPAHQTPLEFARELAARFDVLADGVEVVQDYYDVAFGGRVLSPGRHERIERFLQRLRELSRGALASAVASGDDQLA